MLVEDHEEVWDFLSRRLNRRGFEVTVAVDGQEGVDKSKSSSPDSILLAMNLPVIDGWTAAGMIRADPAIAGVPMIVHAMSDDKDEAIAAGCTDYFSKPVDFSDLLAKIDRHAPKV